MYQRIFCDRITKQLRSRSKYGWDRFGSKISESKELLIQNNIIIESPTLKSPKYDYPSYCKYLDAGYINQLIIIHLGEEKDNEGLAKLIQLQNNLYDIGFECEDQDNLEEKIDPFICTIIDLNLEELFPIDALESLSNSSHHKLSKFCVDNMIDDKKNINSIIFYIYKSGGIKYVGYDGITNNHLLILESVGGCILDDDDIINDFSTVPKFRVPYSLNSHGFRSLIKGWVTRNNTILVYVIVDVELSTRRIDTKIDTVYYQFLLKLSLVLGNNWGHF
uniref:Uncharacterized protein n=1 Tax=Rhizophagus irregularis (strain DAOM 181602 / DAOM 197198 / MUCL 43194) TaxID=747089 RepID=U9ULU6_RHIID